ncbi:Uma2 family endonuclease [Streptomyces ferrugineus]|uniref:Uma2 family endonuclease n=1 Tax=Streptomyces ferrugineus TaxID=1413221 RepID=A0A7M2SKL9_9ACTN|nr:Uma2 family endonuclease [Streptomyces ferrugineus]QOV36028.1 Uma2 family endonuclease [Streptomyces ferrugineus]
MDVIDGDYIVTDSAWDELVWVWKQTDVPRGCKVEIIGGLVTVTPYSARAHHSIAERLHRRLYEVIPEDWGIYQRLATALPSQLGLYVPDLAVVPEEALRTRDDHFVPCAASELVVEVTSKATSDNDRTTKRAGYAEVGVPLYLLIDPLAPSGPSITLYGEPKDGVYRVLCVGRPGEPMILPRPFHIALDTSGFGG